MTSARQNWSLFLVFFGLVILLQACGRIGDNDPLNEDLQSSLVTGVTVNMLKSYCARVESCGLMEFKTCHRQFLSLSNLDSELGLPDKKYKDFREIIIAETRGELTPKPGVAAACLGNLQSLSCEGASESTFEEVLVASELGSLLNLSCDQLYED